MKKFDSINVVPFIDVLLVLLVIVLTTATFISKGIIPINLPKAKSQSNQDLNQTTITIKSDGTIYLEKTKVTIDDLNRSLNSLNPKTPIDLRCDKDAKFQNFVTVLELLKSKKFNNLSIVTKE